jgi:hypothetical protein
MEIAIGGCLMVLAMYLGKRLKEANSQNAALRVQVASLKRQLTRSRTSSSA